jgi:hypothetical protein
VAPSATTTVGVNALDIARLLTDEGDRGMG